MEAVHIKTRKSLSQEDKKVAVELWKAEVPLKTIMKQLQMIKLTLKRILAYARANTEAPVGKRVLKKMVESMCPQALGGAGEGGQLQKY